MYGTNSTTVNQSVNHTNQKSVSQPSSISQVMQQTVKIYRGFKSCYGRWGGPYRGHAPAQPAGAAHHPADVWQHAHCPARRETAKHRIPSQCTSASAQQRYASTCEHYSMPATHCEEELTVMPGRSMTACHDFGLACMAGEHTCWISRWRSLKTALSCAACLLKLASSACRLHQAVRHS